MKPYLPSLPEITSPLSSTTISSVHPLGHHDVIRPRRTQRHRFQQRLHTILPVTPRSPIDLRPAAFFLIPRDLQNRCRHCPPAKAKGDPRFNVISSPAAPRAFLPPRVDL